MNIGLRYDYNSPPINRYGLGTFDFNSGQYVWDLKNPITGAPANVRRGGIAPDRNNFAPRLGIAYAATSRLVVRSSFGLFYNSFGSNYISSVTERERQLAVRFSPGGIRTQCHNRQCGSS